MNIRRLPRPHRLPPEGPQCQVPIAKMSEVTQHYAQPKFRARRGADPSFCCLPAAVVLDGQTYCERHAGQELLRRALLESAE